MEQRPGNGLDEMVAGFAKLKQTFTVSGVNNLDILSRIAAEFARLRLDAVFVPVNGVVVTKDGTCVLETTGVDAGSRGPGICWQKFGLTVVRADNPTPENLRTRVYPT